MALKFFFIQVKGKVSGPLSGSELTSLAHLGKLSPTDLVRQEGSDRWVQANRIRNLAFGSPQEEVGDEIEEILEIEPEPRLESPPFIMPSRQSTVSITGLNLTGNDDLPPPPDYAFVETVATMYNTMGVVTLIGSFFAVLIVSSMDSGGKDASGQKFGSVIGIIIFGAIASITCFAMAQLFTMAINGSKNLHYIMHSNIVAMRVIVNQINKKD